MERITQYRDGLVDAEGGTLSTGWTRGGLQEKWLNGIAEWDEGKRCIGSHRLCLAGKAT
jgi:hypothetical protein